MQHPRDAGLRFQPARDFERALLVPFEPDPHRAQAAQHLVDVVRPGAAAHRDEGVVQPLPACLVGRDGAEQHVGMAGRVFRRRVDRDVDAEVERAGNRAASPRCCPS